MDDATLVHQAAGGDRDAFAAIYERYAGRIHDFLWWVLGDRNVATDALRATFADAAARVHQLGDADLLRPWLFALARHHASLLETGPSPAPAVAPAGGTDARSRLAWVLASATAALSSHDRIVLDLVLRHRLSGAELAAALGADAAEAAALAATVADGAQRDLGLRWVAALNGDDCPALAALLEAWEGDLTPPWRKRLGRHVEECQTCGPLSRRTDPAALLAAAPSLGLDADVGAAVVSQAELASATGRPWPGPPAGFPPPLVSGPPRRWRRPALIAAAVLVVVGLVALFSASRDTTSPLVVGPGSTTSTTPARAGPGSATTAPGGPTTTAAGSESEATSTTGGTAPGATTAATAAGANPTAPTLPTVVTTPPTVATTLPDQAGPDVTIVSIQPNPLTSSSCSTAYPAVTVVVRATDASGIRDVTALVVPAQDDPVTLTSVGGDTWRGTLSGLSFPVSIEATLLVTATDGKGNVTIAPDDVTLVCGG